MPNKNEKERRKIIVKELRLKAKNEFENKYNDDINNLKFIHLQINQHTPL